MPTQSPPIVQAKRLPIGHDVCGRFPTRFLVLDFDGSKYRATFWRTRNRHERKHPDLLTIPTEKAWTGVVERGWVPPHDQPTAWTRHATEGVRLDDVLRWLFEDTTVPWRPIADYVRLTGWGEGLP